MARVRLGVVDGGVFRTSANAVSTPEGQLAVDAARQRMQTETLQQIYTGGKILETGANLFGPAVAGLISRLGETSVEDQRAAQTRLAAAKALRAGQKAADTYASGKADEISNSLVGDAVKPPPAAAPGAVAKPAVPTLAAPPVTGAVPSTQRPDMSRPADPRAPVAPAPVAPAVPAPAAPAAPDGSTVLPEQRIEADARPTAKDSGLSEFELRNQGQQLRNLLRDPGVSPAMRARAEQRLKQIEEMVGPQYPSRLPSRPQEQAPAPSATMREDQKPAEYARLQQEGAAVAERITKLASLASRSQDQAVRAAAATRIRELQARQSEIATEMSIATPSAVGSQMPDVEGADPVVPTTDRFLASGRGDSGWWDPPADIEIPVIKDETVPYESVPASASGRGPSLKPGETLAEYVRRLSDYDLRDVARSDMQAATDEVSRRRAGGAQFDSVPKGTVTTPPYRTDPRLDAAAASENQVARMDIARDDEARDAALLATAGEARTPGRSPVLRGAASEGAVATGAAPRAPEPTAAPQAAVTQALDKGMGVAEAIEAAALTAEDLSQAASDAELTRKRTGLLSFPEAAMLVAQHPERTQEALAALRASGYAGVRARSLTELISGSHLVDAENALVKVGISRLPKEVDPARAAQIAAQIEATKALTAARVNEDNRKTKEEEDRFRKAKAAADKADSDAKSASEKALQAAAVELSKSKKAKEDADRAVELRKKSVDDARAAKAKANTEEEKALKAKELAASEVKLSDARINAANAAAGLSRARKSTEDLLRQDRKKLVVAQTGAAERSGTDTGKEAGRAAARSDATVAAEASQRATAANSLRKELTDVIAARGKARPSARASFQQQEEDLRNKLAVEEKALADLRAEQKTRREAAAGKKPTPGPTPPSTPPRRRLEDLLPE